MRRAACLAALLAACGDGDAARPDASASDATASDAEVEPRFDIDVLVGAGGVSVSLVASPNLDCPERRFPHENECVHRDDVLGCTPTGPCLVTLQIVGGSVVRAEEEGDWDYGNTFMGSLADGDELVVSACADTFRVPLPLLPTERPVITDVTATSEEALVYWTRAAPTTGTVVSFSDGHSQLKCHGPAPDPARLPRNSGGWPGMGNIGLTAVEHVASLETPWGDAYVAGVIGADPLPSPSPAWWGIVIPWVRSGWWWTAWSVGPGVLVDVDGAPEPESVWEMSFRSVTDGSLRIKLYRDYEGLARYEAGETMDTVIARLPEGDCAGTLPHVVPTDDLDLFLDGNLTIALDTGDVPLTCPGESAPTHTLRFAIEADHVLIARPVGP